VIRFIHNHEVFGVENQASKDSQKQFDSFNKESLLIDKH